MVPRAGLRRLLEVLPSGRKRAPLHVGDRHRRVIGGQAATVARSFLGPAGSFGCSRIIGGGAP